VRTTGQRSGLAANDYTRHGTTTIFAIQLLCDLQTDIDLCLAEFKTIRFGRKSRVG
jgi:hypothetical protein